MSVPTVGADIFFVFNCYFVLQSINILAQNGNNCYLCGLKN